MPLKMNEKLEVAKPKDVKDLAGMFGATNKSSVANKEPFKKS